MNAPQYPAEFCELRSLDHSVTRHDVREGSWLCKNTLSQGPEWDEVLMRTGLSGFDYARIAAISGCMPIMFITLVRL